MFQLLPGLAGSTGKVGSVVVQQSDSVIFFSFYEHLYCFGFQFGLLLKGFVLITQNTFVHDVFGASPSYLGQLVGFAVMPQYGVVVVSSVDLSSSSLLRSRALLDTLCVHGVA